MKFKFSNKFCLFFTAIISIFAVTVAGIATFARFQQTTKLTNDTKQNTPPVKSGSSDLSITGVTGYKQTYTELGEGMTDYSSGYVTEYGTSSESAYGNTNQGDVTSFDVPQEGIGFYLVGEENWCTSQGFDTADVWKYKASIRMEDDNVNSNYAYITGIELYENTEIKVRHHFIENNRSDPKYGKTKDEWVNSNVVKANNSEPNYAEYNNTTGNVKVLVSGKYDIYLNGDQNLYFNRKSDVTPKSRRPKYNRNIGPKKIDITSSDYIYFDPTSNWNRDGAWFAAYCWNDNTIYFENNQNWSSVYVYMRTSSNDSNKNATWPGVLMTKISSTSNCYQYTVPSNSNYDRCIFNAGDGQGQPQTVDINFSSSNFAELYRINGESNGKKTGYWDDTYTPPTNRYRLQNVSNLDKKPIYYFTPNTSFQKFLFVRMKNNSSALSFKNMRNQTQDLTYDGTNNLFTINSGSGNNYTCTTSVFDILKNLSINVQMGIDVDASGNWTDGNSEAIPLISNDNITFSMANDKVLRSNQDAFKITLESEYINEIRYGYSDISNSTEMQSYFVSNSNGNIIPSSATYDVFKFNVTVTLDYDETSFDVTPNIALSFVPLKYTHFNISIYKKKHDGTLNLANPIVKKIDDLDELTALNSSEIAAKINGVNVDYYSRNTAQNKRYIGSPVANPSDSDLFVSGKGSTDADHPTELRTYVEEQSGTLTVYKRYVNYNGVVTNGTSSNFPYYKDTPFTISDLSSQSSAMNISADSDYTFDGYYMNTTFSNPNNKYASNATQTFTSDTASIYAVFRPVGPAHVYTYETYFLKNGSDYIPFSSINASYSKKDLGDTDVYSTDTFNVPTNLETEYVAINSSDTNYFSGVYKFTFEGWYKGSSSSECNYQTLYTNTEMDGETDYYLFGRMVCDVSTLDTLYVDSSSTNWDNTYLYQFYSSTPSLVLTKSVLASAKVNKFMVPNETSEPTAKFLFSSASTLGGGQTRTCNIDYEHGYKYHEENDQNNKVKHDGDAKGSSFNMITLWDQNSSFDGYKPWNWSRFYQIPDGDSPNGLYVIGELSNNPAEQWTFKNAIKLTTVDDPNLPGVKYQTEDLHIDTIDKFKIWQYNNGRGFELGYSSLNNDSETKGIVDAASSATSGNNNIVIKSGLSGGKFKIYLVQPDGVTQESQYKIRIVDLEKSSTLFIKQSLESYGTSTFNMGYGDFDITKNTGDRIAIYEKGLHITSTDIANSSVGGIEFTIRAKYQGAYHWYYYNDDSNHGLNSGSEITPSEGSSYEFGDGDSEVTGRYKTCKTFKLTTPGYYNFYVLNDDTISIAKIPGDYGEGYYIIPTIFNNEEPPVQEDYQTTSAHTNDWENGIKMKQLPSGYDNIAVYSCYVAKGGARNIYIKSFLSGVESPVINRFDTYGNTNTIVNTHNNNAVLARVNTTTGVLSFDHDGIYNIFVYNYHGYETISVAPYSQTTFYSLNSISKSATTAERVKNSNTSLVLKVDFTVTYDASINMSALVEMIKTGNTGLADYVLFDYYVDPVLNGQNCYDFMREYFYGFTKTDQTTKALDNANNQSTHNHTLYIILDYNPRKVNDLVYSQLPNNFVFVIKTRQLN